MMASWIKEATASEIVDGNEYFIGIRPKHDSQGWFFFSQNRKGKQMVSSKPGIAIRYVGSDAMRDVLSNRPELGAVIIPADADKRWKMR